MLQELVLQILLNGSYLGGSVSWNKTSEKSIWYIIILYFKFQTKQTLRACHTVTSLVTTCGELTTRHMSYESWRDVAICRLLSYNITISRTSTGSAYKIFKQFKNLAMTRPPKWAEPTELATHLYIVVQMSYTLSPIVMCSRCPKQRRVIAGSLRVTYDLLWYSFLYAEIWRIHYDISASIFDNCTTICEFTSSSDEMSWKPHKWEWRTVKHHFQHIITQDEFHRQYIPEIIIWPIFFGYTLT